MERGSRSPTSRRQATPQASSAAVMEKLPSSDCPSTNVKVVCRVRPMNDHEKKSGNMPVVTASSERREVSLVRVVGGSARQSRSSYVFDEVLTSVCTQTEVFTATLQPLIKDVLNGYEATAFAYGQTGTGKTYTMEGDLHSEEGRGLVPRAAAALLDALNSQAYSRDHVIHASYLEIYNEELCDLLVPADAQRRLELMDSGRGVCCNGLHEAQVSSIDEILDHVRAAQERRRVAETRMNERSSRSHTIFTLKVRCRKTVSMGELENIGKLHLVDLAGSECAKKAWYVMDDAAQISTHQRQTKLLEEERERRSINQSLLTLGRVIAALRSESGRVPYRDSKLTRLLQDALGGGCKTVLIATISPAMNSVEETISTLSYAHQAAGIKNKPVVASLLKTFRDPRLSQVEGGGGPCENSMAELEVRVAYLQQEVEEAQRALARSYLEHKELSDRAEASEVELNARTAELERAHTALADLRQRVTGIGEHVQVLQHNMEEKSGQLASAAGAAESAVKAGGAMMATTKDASEDRYSGTLLSPMVSHVAQLQSAVKTVDEQMRKAEALAAFCATGIQAIHEQHETLQSQASSGKVAHDAMLAEFPVKLEAELGSLGHALTVCGGAIGDVLEAMQNRLSGLVQRLPRSTEECQGNLEALVSKADADLAKAWSLSLTDLPQAAAKLRASTQKLEESNTSVDTVQTRISDSAATLKDALATEVAQLKETRDAVAAEVRGLQELEERERKAVGMLDEQRSTLQGQVNELTTCLESLKANLSSTREDLACLEKSQRLRRERALEVICAAASKELGLLDEELAASSATMKGRLQDVASGSSDVSSALQNLLAGSLKQLQEVAGEVTGMGEARVVHCQAVGASQEVAAKASGRVLEHCDQHREEQRKVSEEVRKWGEVSSAVQAEMSEVHSMVTRVCSCEEQAKTEWTQARAAIEGSSQAWAAENARALEEVQASTKDITACRGNVGDLQQQIATCRDAANSHLLGWNRASKNHGHALQELSDALLASASASAELEDERLKQVEALQHGVGQVLGDTGSLAEQAGAILDGAKTHRMSVAAEAARVEASFDEVSTQVDNFGARAREVFGKLTTSVEELSDAVRATGASASNGSSRIVTQAERLKQVEALQHSMGQLLGDTGAVAEQAGAILDGVTTQRMSVAAEIARVEACSDEGSTPVENSGARARKVFGKLSTSVEELPSVQPRMARRPSRDKFGHGNGSEENATPTAASVRRVMSGKLSTPMKRQQSSPRMAMRDLNSAR